MINIIWQGKTGKFHGRNFFLFFPSCFYFLAWMADLNEVLTIDNVATRGFFCLTGVASGNTESCLLIIYRCIMK